jgi:hypothetical protein
MCGIVGYLDDGTLWKVAAIRYRQVETADFSVRNPEITKSLQDAELHCGSMHILIPAGVEETLEYTSEVGAKYVISSVTLPTPPWQRQI